MDTTIQNSALSLVFSHFAKVCELKFSSTDNQRQYDIKIFVPKGNVPADGYPCCFFLDGNSVIKDINKRPDFYTKQQSILVTIGYQGEQEFFVKQRSFDYTPAVNHPLPTMAEIARNIQGGGADLFLDLITDQLLNYLPKNFPIDINKLTLWGHSLGGVLCLYCLFTRPQLFNRYLAADPSLWWNNGYLTKLPNEQTAIKQLTDTTAKQLYIVIGCSAELIASGKPRTLRPDITLEIAAKVRAERMTVPVDAAITLCKQLHEQQKNQATKLNIRYIYCPGVQHATLLHESLEIAMHLTNK